MQTDLQELLGVQPVGLRPEKCVRHTRRPSPVDNDHVIR